MPDNNPPARRRPTSAGAAPAGRAAPPRRTGAQQRAAPEPSAGEKLICTAGPKAGTEFPLTGDEELVIGRATDNLISIPDTSVSRKHCSVRRGEDGWYISDLGSGNGTVVNGERIDGETLLRNGDVITIGDTELNFADTANVTGKAPMPVRRSGGDVPARRSIPGRPDVRARLSRPGAPATDPAKKKKMMLIGGGVAVLLVGGLVAGLVVKKRSEEADAVARQAKMQQIEAIRSVFQDGKNLVIEGKWADAKGKFEEVKAAAPNFPGVDDYLARAAIEIPNEDHLNKAKDALAKNQLGIAATELSAVKDSQQFDRIKVVKSGLEKKLEARLDDATKMLASLPSDKAEQRAVAVQAQEITDDILKVNPEHRDAQIVNQNAKALIAKIDYVAPPPPPEPKRPWLTVQARYSQGDMTGALALADECAGGFKQCKGLAKDIRNFADMYKRVEDLDARGLAKLLALDRDISDGKGSPMGRTAGTRAASLYFKNASAAKNAGQWGPAISWADKCLDADRGNAGCKAIAEEVRGKSKDEYMRCYAMKDTNPDEAVTCFKGVVQMTSNGDELREKSQNWIEKLSR